MQISSSGVVHPWKIPDGQHHTESGEPGKRACCSDTGLTLNTLLLFQPSRPTWMGMETYQDDCFSSPPNQSPEVVVPLAVTQPSTTKPKAPKVCLPFQTIPIFHALANSLPSLSLKVSGFWKQFSQGGFFGQCWLGALLSQNVSLALMSSHARKLKVSTPTDSTDPAWREASLLPSKPSY